MPLVRLTEAYAYYHLGRARFTDVQYQCGPISLVLTSFCFCCFLLSVAMVQENVQNSYNKIFVHNKF